ncbi:MAG: hypothetical protein AAFY25_01920 [Pseudomonadota bacterium]
MAHHTTGKSAKQVTPDREDRLKAALKANMAKRKAQAQARQTQGTGGNQENTKDNSKG